jgi:hypothetical protein
MSLHALQSRRLRNLCGRLRSLPSDIQQRIADLAVEEVRDDVVRETIMMNLARHVYVYGPCDVESPSILMACLPLIMCTHRRRKWQHIFVEIGVSLVINQYNSFPVYYNQTDRIYWAIIGSLVKDLQRRSIVQEIYNVMAQGVTLRPLPA